MRKLAKSVQELAKCWLVVIQGAMPALAIAQHQTVKITGLEKAMAGI